MNPPLDDLRARVLGITAFALVIPLTAGLYGPLRPRDPMFWLGAALFLGLSWAIWHGNRYLLFRHRRPLDWLHHPARRVGVLLAGITLFTAPLTVATLALWMRGVRHVPMDWPAVRAVALANVVCVIFVAHVYETVLLIRDRADDLVRVERLERARAEAELLALRRQVDPHFIFNCLNTLQHLVGDSSPRAVSFIR